jgi:hypothetical protein
MLGWDIAGSEGGSGEGESSENGKNFKGRENEKSSRAEI